ncbi:MAG: LapA family protein [Bosea sp. (in: a-proteobacteria)]
MRALLKALFIVPLALGIILFAVANRQVVRLSLDPLSRDAPQYTFDAPLFAVIMTALAVGILVGGFATWLAQSKHRKAKRQLAKEAERLRTEAEALRAMSRDATALATLPARNG